MRQRHPDCAVIPAEQKAGLRVMFLAKHARAGGGLDRVDGNHAVYHHELRTTLERIGLNVVSADSFAEIERRPDADFVISLLNRGGFEHSEMLAPLQLTRHRVPFLGATPILRGLSDDKHLCKLVARARGVPTADWAAYRRGAGPVGDPPCDGPWVVKPNASSASWGVAVADDWADARAQVHALWRQEQDVVVERWTPMLDVAVPVIGGAGGEPWILPPMMYLPDGGPALRSYEEKRGLVPTADDPLSVVDDPVLRRRLETLTRPLLGELWPFDYGRFEYRYDPATGALSFMEVNLSCNLWSRKTISRSAATLGVSHDELVESIVGHSLRRQGVRAGRLGLAA
jgi:D-alanine-D-alanine ligase